VYSREHRDVAANPREFVVKKIIRVICQQLVVNYLDIYQKNAYKDLLC
jgi:hypothetical protein